MFVQLRREKVELENALEQEQESLVNRLWKRMDKLETEKRLAFIKIINDNAKQERYSKKCIVDQKWYSLGFYIYQLFLFEDCVLPPRENNNLLVFFQ